MRTTILITSAIGVAAIASWYWYRKRRYCTKFRPAITDWRRVGHVAEIDIYPVISCAALTVNEADCEQFGPVHRGIRDRSLLLLDDDGRIASTSTYPHMLNIKSTIDDNGALFLTAPDATMLRLNVQDILLRNGDQVRYKERKFFKLPLIQCDAVHHEWFSRVILKKDSGLKLYISLNPILETSWWRTIKPDFAAFMVMSAKSVQDLNKRLLKENRVHPLQFRGNLLIQPDDHIAPYDEDKWLWLKIGDDEETATILSFNEICTRCIVPNISVTTCERNSDYEPLRTLNSYRLISNPKEPDMGVRFDVHKRGSLKTGAPVYVIYKDNN